MDKFKEIWQTPRYRALIILALYIIFFAVMFTILKASPKKESNKPLTNYYRFEIEVDGEKMEGLFNNNVITFIYNGKEYTYRNDGSNNEEIEYQDILDYIDIDKVLKLASENELYSKTEYKDLSIAKTYKIDNREVIIYEKNNKIYEIDVDDYKIIYKY